jgi:putative peptidoglycan lipid II flippase
VSASEAPEQAGRSGATRVALGILCSRVLGFVRERAIAHYFGLGPFADVFTFALRGPNLLQNLLGEGVLSASFIPIYSRFLAEGKKEEARRFAGAVLGLLCVVAAAIAILGVLAARPLVAILASGYLKDAARVGGEGSGGVDRFEIAVAAVRWMFPMTAFLVLSAWALGVLNSHRRFFMAYVAPVAWNTAILAGIFVAVSAANNAGAGAGAGAGAANIATDTARSTDLLLAACIGAFVGGVLQFLSQLPLVWRLAGAPRPSLSLGTEGVRVALASFLPVVLGRGAVQISSYLETWFASFLVVGAQAAQRAATTFYLLPVSLFGMAVSSAQLPELSATADREPAQLGGQLDRALRQMAFLNLPTLLAYVVLGRLVVGAIYESGKFGENETRLGAWVLAAYSLGLLASTSSRLLINAFYARQQAATPSRIALARVLSGLALGVPAMLILDRVAVVPGSGLRLGAVGLALGSAFGSWVEFGLLVRALRRSVAPGFRLPWRSWSRMSAASLVALALAGGLALMLRDWPVLQRAAVCLPLYAAVYLGIARWWGMGEFAAWVGRWRRA